MELNNHQTKRISTLHIWILHIDNEETIPETDFVLAKTFLSEDEIQRANRYIRKEDRNRFVLAHAFCRQMLSAFGEVSPKQWCFEKEGKGRPYIKRLLNSHGIDFNLSHTKNAIACMLSKTHRVGVDIEASSRIVNLNLLVEKQFSTIEQTQFKGLSEQEKQALFFKIWTLKEAYIKNTGKGLSENLQNFGFDLRGKQPICFLDASAEIGNKKEALNNYRFGIEEVNGTHQLAWSIKHADTSFGRQDIMDKPQISEYRLRDLREILNC